MSSTSEGSPAVDRARELLCRQISQMVKAGTWTVRTRIVGPPEDPIEALFYAHRDNAWHIRPERVTDRDLVRALQDTLEMLGSREHGDDWSVRQAASAEAHDTDIQFHREKLEPRIDNQLESALMGLLFRDSHDSKQDRRRAIRRRR